RITSVEAHRPTFRDLQGLIQISLGLLEVRCLMEMKPRSGQKRARKVALEMPLPDLIHRLIQVLQSVLEPWPVFRRCNRQAQFRPSQSKVIERAPENPGPLFRPAE